MFLVCDIFDFVIFIVPSWPTDITENLELSSIFVWYV